MGITNQSKSNKVNRGGNRMKRADYNLTIKADEKRIKKPDAMRIKKPNHNRVKKGAR